MKKELKTLLKMSFANASIGQPLECGLIGSPRLKLKTSSISVRFMVLLLTIFVHATSAYAQFESDLIVASRNNNLEEVKKHLRAGANPEQAKDEDGNTPLHFAAKYGNAKMVEILMIYWAGDELRNNRGDSARMVALFFGNREALIAINYIPVWRSKNEQRHQQDLKDKKATDVMVARDNAKFKRDESEKAAKDKAAWDSRNAAWEKQGRG